MKTEINLTVRHLSSSIITTKSFDRIVKHPPFCQLQLVDRAAKAFTQYGLTMVLGDKAAQIRLNDGAKRFSAGQAAGKAIAKNLREVFAGEPLLIIQHDSDTIVLVSNVNLQQKLLKSLHGVLRKPKQEKVKVSPRECELLQTIVEDINRSGLRIKRITLDVIEDGDLFSNQDRLAEIICSGPRHPVFVRGK
jgi:hypothetical protein